MTAHVRALARRDYPSCVHDSLDFTVCYVSSDDMLTAAYEQDPGLFYTAVSDRILIATSVTLLAVLWASLTACKETPESQPLPELCWVSSTWTST